MASNGYSFAVNHNEAATLVATNGHRVSYIFEGEPGISKSTILKTLQRNMGDAYDYIYVDVPLRDIPQVALSMPDHESQTTKDFIHASWIGTDRNKPKVVMLDEIFKGNEYVRLMFNRLLLEGMVGDYALPEGSIVFGTTNYATDGVGDRTNGHTNSRISRIPFRKPTQAEWKAWAVDNHIHELVLTWVENNPAIFQSYKDTEFDAREFKDGVSIFNMIYHPQHNKDAYVCPRTLELASHQIYGLEKTGEALLTKALIGTVGMTAAMDMATLIALGSDLPSPADIVTAPESARLPKSTAAQLMMVFKSVQYLKPENMDAFATYFFRFPLEMTSTWVKTIVSSNLVSGFALKNSQIKAFAINNAWVL